MTRWIFLHLPHLVPPLVAFAFLARLGAWAAEQPPQQLSDEDAAAWVEERARRRAARTHPVRRPVAIAGTLALTPAVVAVVTGLVIYTWNLRGDRPSAALVWAHVLVSVLALALTTGKVAALGRRRLAASLTLRRPQDGLSSVVLLALGVPLVATGAWLLWRPSGTSFADYTHLVASVWWTVLLQWHLWRYLGRAVAAATRPEGAALR